MPAPQFRRRALPGGFTLLEVLVAVALASVFLAALYSSFIGMLRTSDQTKARLDALRNGRTAIMTMTDELKSVNRVGAQFLLVGLNENAGFGDGIDNDDDDGVDEEIVNGRDSDGDWTVAGDNHANVGPPGQPIFERFPFTTNAPFSTDFPGTKDDLGDFGVDEDIQFGRDIIVFRIAPTAPVEGLTLRTITYTIGNFEEQRNVLIRQSRSEFVDQPAVVTTAPLAFGVLGLDLLYWDANRNPNPGTQRRDRPYWVETWDSTQAAQFDPPRLPLPASVYARVTLYADRKRFELYQEGKPVQTLTLQTVVNIEETIGDALYPRPVI